MLITINRKHKQIANGLFLPLFYAWVANSGLGSCNHLYSIDALNTVTIASYQVLWVTFADNSPLMHAITLKGRLMA